MDYLSDCTASSTSPHSRSPNRLRASLRAALSPPCLPRSSEPRCRLASVPPSEPRCRLRARLPPSRAAVSVRASLRAALPSPDLPPSRAAVPGPPSEPRCRLLPALQGRAAACSPPPSNTLLGFPVLQGARHHLFSTK